MLRKRRTTCQHPLHNTAWVCASRCQDELLVVPHKAQALPPDSPAPGFEGTEVGSISGRAGKQACPRPCLFMQNRGLKSAQTLRCCGCAHGGATLAPACPRSSAPSPLCVLCAGAAGSPLLPALPLPPVSRDAEGRRDMLGDGGLPLGPSLLAQHAAHGSRELVRHRAAAERCCSGPAAESGVVRGLTTGRLHTAMAQAGSVN